MKSMKYFLLLVTLVIAYPVFAVPLENGPKISHLEFDGVYFGDFPATDMICIRGLCSVGEMSLGANDKFFTMTNYSQLRALTHYRGVKISTPEFGYINDKMARVTFKFKDKEKNQQICIDAVRNGLDADYGLFPVEGYDEKKNDSLIISELYLTKSKSLVEILQHGHEAGNPLYIVRISDPYLMNQARKLANPNYVPILYRALENQPLNLDQNIESAPGEKKSAQP